MLKKFLYSGLLLLPIYAFCYQQQYVSTNVTTQNTVRSESNADPGKNTVDGNASQENSSADASMQQYKEIWMKNCTASISNKDAQTLGDDFCACGWRHIESGELPLNLLESNAEADILKANNILRVINQKCMVEAMAEGKKG